MRGSRSAAPTTAPEAGARWPRHWLSQSGAAQAASLHFSARLLPARATQLSAARPAMRGSRSAAPTTAPEAGARWPRHWLSQSGAAQAASLHFSARLLPARATQLSAARPAMRGSRSAAPTTAPEAGARWPRHWLSQSGAAQAASLHFSARLLPARATQLSAARPAMRGSRSAAPTTAPEAGARWPRHWLSQSGAAQAASLHFSARLLPARATQLSAARPAMRRSGSVAPPTAPASGAGWPRHWLSQSSSRAAQAALLHFSARLLPARATQL